MSEAFYHAFLSWEGEIPKSGDCFRLHIAENALTIHLRRVSAASMLDEMAANLREKMKDA